MDQKFLATHRLRFPSFLSTTVTSEVVPCLLLFRLLYHFVSAKIYWQESGAVDKQVLVVISLQEYTEEGIVPTTVLTINHETNHQYWSLQHADVLLTSSSQEMLRHHISEQGCVNRTSRVMTLRYLQRSIKAPLFKL
jgi:hypothetical protein